jgi:hypothetical protein
MAKPTNILVNSDKYKLLYTYLLTLLLPVYEYSYIYILRSDILPSINSIHHLVLKILFGIGLVSIYFVYRKLGISKLIPIMIYGFFTSLLLIMLTEIIFMVIVRQVISLGLVDNENLNKHIFNFIWYIPIIAIYPLGFFFWYKKLNKK